MKNKSNHPEATLRKGALPPVTGVKSHGLKEGSDKAPAAESNVETLRHGNKPGTQAARQAPANMSVQKKAHGFNERSQKGGANKMAYPCC
jgi:hypothetical protein